MTNEEYKQKLIDDLNNIPAEKLWFWEYLEEFLDKYIDDVAEDLEAYFSYLQKQNKTHEEHFKSILSSINGQNKQDDD